MEIPFRAASQTAFGPVGEDGRARYSATVCLDPTRLPQGSEYEVVPRYIPSSVSIADTEDVFFCRYAFSLRRRCQPFGLTDVVKTVEKQTA